MKPPCAIVIMAKAPVAGYAKTRLIPALGAAGAAQVAERLLSHSIAAAQAAALGPVDLCCAPDDQHASFVRHARAGLVTTSIQGDGDLGARMARAFDRRLETAEPVLLMGTDCPGLDAAVLRAAAAALDRFEAVFVPALDGGYALVGLRRRVPQIFANMHWSTSSVMAQTRRRLKRSGMAHHELPPLPDVDEPRDLVHLPPGWLPDPDLAGGQTMAPGRRST